MKLTFGKEERLKSRKLIKTLYEEGKTVKVYPLRMVYLQTKHTSTYPIQTGVSVSKRYFKRAVDRNRIKRLLRETYRTNKGIVYSNLKEPYICMITFIDSKHWDYKDLDEKMKKLLTSFLQATEIKNNKDENIL